MAITEYSECAVTVRGTYFLPGINCFYTDCALLPASLFPGLLFAFNRGAALWRFGDDGLQFMISLNC